MMNISPVKALRSDKRSIKRFYKEHGYSASFMGFDTAYLIKLDDHIIASVIVSYITDNNNQALLHGLFVHKDYRNQHYASLLIQHAKQKHLSMVCFVDKALMPFYGRLGFNLINNNNQISSVNLERLYIYLRYIPQLVAVTYLK